MTSFQSTENRALKPTFHIMTFSNHLSAYEEYLRLPPVMAGAGVAQSEQRLG
jgi:hypothetical protein